MKMFFENEKNSILSLKEIKILFCKKFKDLP